MVGEVVTGAVSGAMQGITSAAPAVMEAPIAAVSALPAVMEAPAVAIEAAYSAVEAVPEVVSAPLEAVESVVGVRNIANAIPGVGNAFVEAQGIVQEGLGSLPGAEITQELSGNSVIGELHVYLQKNDAAGALEFLAFGKFQQDGSLAEGQEGVGLDLAFLDLQKMLPESAHNMLQGIEGLTIPDAIRNDPEFLKQFMETLSKNSENQKSTGDIAKDATALHTTIKASAKKAVEEHAAKQLTEKDLDELKRKAAKKAAMLAIRQHMNIWRQSVVKDTKLTQTAQHLALRRIDLLEKRLLTQEAMKWDGVSVMKLISLAAVWMKEMQEDSLPQPKL